MVKLPLGFSPVNAARQAGDVINPFNGSHDYDVLSDKSFAGGWRNPPGADQAQSGNDWAAQQSAKFGSPGGTGTGNAGGSNLVDEHGVFKGKKPTKSI